MSAHEFSRLDHATNNRQRFEDKVKKLFISQDTGWDVPYLIKKNVTNQDDAAGSHVVLGGEKSDTIHSSTELHDTLQMCEKDVDSARYFLIYQKGSWGRFQISVQGFNRLIGSELTFGPFLDLITSFGQKNTSRDDDFCGLNSRFNTLSGFGSSYEICYNVRYVFRHGRPDEYPWSFRQTAVYHKGCIGQVKSTWIFLQPPVALKIGLEGMAADRQVEDMSCSYQPLLVHLLLLHATESGWRSFITDLECDVEKLNDKALYSRVGRPSKFDYSVTFKETQDLQLLRQRLLKTRTVLETNLRITVSLRSFFSKLTLLEGSSSLQSESASIYQDLIWELENLLHRYKSHQSSVMRLLEVADGTMSLLMKILDYRHDENIRTNISSTRDLLSAAEQETTVLRLIASQTQQDSRSMKIVTFVALIYLPGTLVASVYSSHIIKEDGTGRFGFNPSEQLLSFLVVTALLTVVTVSGAVLWDKGLWTRWFGKIKSGPSP